MIHNTQRARFIFLIFIHNLLFHAVYTVAERPFSYKELEAAYTASLPLVTAEQAVQNNAHDSQKPDLHSVLSETEKMQLAFSLCYAGDDQKKQSDTVCDYDMATLIKETDLCCGSGAHPGHTVCHQLARTDSLLGRVSLLKMLTTPLADVSVIKKRQDFIKLLVEHEQLYNQVQALVTTVTASEGGILSFWKQLDTITQSKLQSLYFSLPGLRGYNQHAPALEWGVRFDNVHTVWKMCCNAIGYICELYVLGKVSDYLAQAQGITPATYTISKALSDAFNRLKMFVNPVYWQRIIQYRGSIVAHLEDEGLSSQEIANIMNFASTGQVIQQKINTHVVHTDNALYKWTMFGIGGLALTGTALMQFQTMKTAFAFAYENQMALNYMHTHLIDVASIIDSARKVYRLVHADPRIAQGLQTSHALDAFFDASKEMQDTLGTLLADLRTTTFRGQASFFSYQGRVLAAFSKMNEYKQLFIPVLQALGELDACLSLAKLYKEYQNKRVRYTFVDFIETHKPHVAFTAFWNPLVDPEIVVSNDIVLGGDKASCVILTGSNMGGKSTLLKALLINMILAHTVGIVAADRAVITPCIYLGSYLHVADDISSGNSRFQAEVLRAKSLMKMLRTLPVGQYGFIVIDELFAGTAIEKGQSAAYKVAEYIAGFDGVLCLVATHFPALHKLEQKKPGICCAMRLDAYKDAQGNLVRPFILERGVSMYSSAQDILQNELEDIDFDSEI